jgi:transcriptional regulator with XRE-family HTH domain
MLDRLLKRDSPRLSQRSFAKKAGISGGYPAHFVSGERPPPIDKLDAMADALELEGEEREQFIESAHLAHATEEVRALVGRLRAELEDTRENHRRIVAHLRGIGHKLPKSLGDV